MLVMAGIENYGSHSYRDARLLKASAKGASINQIVKAGDWTNAQTFNTFYNKPVESGIGQIILNRGEQWGTEEQFTG